MASTLLTKCIGDAAYIEAATKQAEAIKAEAERWAAMQVAIMLAQKLIDDSITDMQAAIANRRYALAKEILEHAKLTWPKEKAFVEEAMAEASHTADYTGVQSLISEVNAREDAAVDSASRLLECAGIELTGCDEARMRRGMAQAKTDLVSHSMRAAEARAHALNDRRYSRQYAAVGLGRGKLQAALALGRLGDSKVSLANALRGTINSGMELWGYASTRWTHGGNYATGPNGITRVVPTWSPRIENTVRAEVPKVEAEVPDASNSWLDRNDWRVTDTLWEK